LARQRHDLERLTHLPWQQQAARLPREPYVLHSVRGFRDELLHACPQQKRGLRAEAGDIQPGGNRRLRNPREIDPGGDVLHAYVDVWIVMDALLEVAAQRAGSPLRMIVVRPRQPVIEHQHEPPSEAGPYPCDPRSDPQTDLRGISFRERRRQLAHQRGTGARQFRVRRGVALDERNAPICRHAQLPHTALSQREPPARERVEHLVGQDHTADRPLRQAVEPDDPFADCGRKPSQPLSLALGEIGADFQDGIARGQLPAGGEALEDHRRHAPGARAQLQDLSVLAQHLGALPRHAAAEEIGDLRCRHEVPAGAELHAARAVVPEAGGVERQLHELLERDPVPGGPDTFANQRRDASGLRFFFR